LKKNAVEETSNEALQRLLFGNGGDSPEEELAEDELLAFGICPFLEVLSGVVMFAQKFHQGGFSRSGLPSDVEYARAGSKPFREACLKSRFLSEKHLRIAEDPAERIGPCGMDRPESSAHLGKLEALENESLLDQILGLSKCGEQCIELLLQVIAAALQPSIKLFQLLGYAGSFQPDLLKLDLDACHILAEEC
jgi:hypothetical protein